MSMKGQLPFPGFFGILMKMRKEVKTMDIIHPLSGAKWIAGSTDCQSPVFFRRFHVGQPSNAVLHITGLGYFSAQVNGSSVTEHRLQPVCSEYSARDLTQFQYPLKDHFTYRIYFCSYDVTALLREGENELSIQLGNGWYRQAERTAEGPPTYGDTLKTIYCLELTAGDERVRLCSDGSEVWRDSFIRYNNLFTGETHDLGFIPGPEEKVCILPDEEAILSPQAGVPDKLIRTLVPRLLWDRDGRRIYDTGENISGLVRLKVSGGPGERVVLRFSEELTADGSLDFESTGAHYVCVSGRRQIQQDECICGEKPAVFEPRFCWHTFRYFEVEGPGFEPEVLVIHSNAPVTGRFRSDSEGLNFLFDAFVRTQLNNMHGSIPSDCPHRERLGYTGDGQVAAMAAMLTLDTKDFYRKWMQDILDTQDIESGHTQHTAPFGGGGGGPVGWGGAIAVVPYRYFKRYGDTSLFESSWDGIEKWIRYIQTRMDSGLIVREEEKGWCLGDWVTLEPIQLPEPFVNTCLFIRYLDMLTEAAPLIGKASSVSNFRRIQELCRRAVRKTFFDDTTGHFCGGVQGADAYGLHAGMGDERTEKLLVERYDTLMHFDTGFIGTDVLLEELFRLGAYETAYKLLSSEEMGSFLYMKRHGATTLWERWDGKESHCHPMFGGCVRHLFEGFLGIRQAYGTGGYQDVTVEPRLPAGVSFMEGSFPTDRGMLSVSLRREKGIISSEIRLPE